MIMSLCEKKRTRMDIILKGRLSWDCFLKKILFLAKTQGISTWEGMVGKSVWMGVNGGMEMD